MKRHVRLATAGLLAGLTSSASAAIWVNEFNNFSGSDATATSAYTDTGGSNPLQYEQASSFFSGAGALPAGWLTQGTISGSNKSAKFTNTAETPTALNGRARFGSYLPTSMDATGGAGVAWRMRVGAANPTRGPIEVALTKTGADSSGVNANTASVFVRLRNSGHVSGMSYVDIIRHGGGLYDAQSGSNKISTLVLGSNLTNEYHNWTLSAIWRPSDSAVFWNLWLDGTQLLFSGAAGSPNEDPDDAGPLGAQQFSFKTLLHEGFNGGTNNRPYIGLGELNNQNEWDFDFDYVNFRDDSAAYFVPEPGSLLLALGGLVLLRRRVRLN